MQVLLVFMASQPAASAAVDGERETERGDSIGGDFLYSSMGLFANWAVGGVREENDDR